MFVSSFLKKTIFHILNTTIIFWIFFNPTLFSFEIPFSTEEIKSSSNHISEFLRIYPADSLLCPYKNDAWFWHDENNLYILWEGEIGNDFEKGNFSPRDYFVKSDYLRLEIITDINNYYSYVFYFFPLLNKYDAVRNSNLHQDKNWDSSYEYNSKINDDNWVVKITIPFQDLRFYGSPPYHWKFLFTRFFFKEKEFFAYPFATLKMGKDYFRKGEDIVINEKIKKNRNYHFRPYTVINYDILSRKINFDKENFGMDFSLKPNYSTKLKLSVNPDFSDVPLDDEIDIYNLKYAPFYPENRYFFTEDFNVFGVDNYTFYSRNILQPQYALKFTGNTKNFSYGVLSTRDKQISEDGIKTNDDDFYNIIALNPHKKDLNCQITLLNRMNKNYHNEVIHFVPNWEFAKNKTIWLDLNLSTREVDGLRKNGYFFRGGYSFLKNDFKISLKTETMNKNYFADTGKISEKDYYYWSVEALKNMDLKHDFFKNLVTHFEVEEEIEISSNKIIERISDLSVYLDSKIKLNLWVNYKYGEEMYFSKIHNKWKFFVGLEWEKWKWLSPSITVSRQKTLVYSFNDTFMKNYFQLSLEGDLNKYFGYRITADNIRYENFPESDTNDDNYWFGNFDLSVNFSNSLSVTNGFRFNNYEWYDSIGYLGMFGNLKWEIRKNLFVYVGYKGSDIYYTNETEPNYKKLYFKMIAKF